MVVWVLLAVAAVLAVVLLAASIRLVRQFERGVVFRFERVFSRTRPHGLTLIVPFADRMRKINMQTPARLRQNGNDAPASSPPTATPVIARLEAAADLQTAQLGKPAGVRR
jgi:regulator of protease activity HflC (stomatin/prohibitin superfamily)